MYFVPIYSDNITWKQIVDVFGLIWMSIVGQPTARSYLAAVTRFAQKADVVTINRSQELKKNCQKLLFEEKYLVTSK